MSLPTPYYQWPPTGVDWYYSDDAVAIAHGDCREILPHVEADVLLTDPPYALSASSLRSATCEIAARRMGQTVIDFGAAT